MGKCLLTVLMALTTIRSLVPKILMDRKKSEQFHGA
jgi:hypothetical protein